MDCLVSIDTGIKAQPRGYTLSYKAHVPYLGTAMSRRLLAAAYVEESVNWIESFLKLAELGSEIEKVAKTVVLSHSAQKFSKDNVF